MSDVGSNVNILIVISISRALELGFNLFSTITLAKKGFLVFLKKIGHPSKLYFRCEFVGRANIMENQYVVELAEDTKSATVNMAVSLIIQTLHA